YRNHATALRAIWADQQKKVRARFPPGTPDWAIARPIRFPFHDVPGFDLQGLSFLFTRKTGWVIGYLPHIELRYRDIRQTVDDHSQWVDALHSSIAGLASVDPASADWGALGARGNRWLINRVEFASKHMEACLEAGEKCFENAHTQMRTVFVELFGEDRVLG